MSADRKETSDKTDSHAQRHRHGYHARENGLNRDKFNQVRQDIKPFHHIYNRLAVQKIRAALFLVTAALASSPVLTSVAAATKKDVSSAKDKKSALEQEKKKTEEAIKSLQGLKSNTESYVKELDTKMNDLQSQVTKLENNISSKQKSIDETAVKLEEAQKTEKKQYASMKMRIKYMYEKGDSSYLNLLLEAR